VIAAVAVDQNVSSETSSAVTPTVEQKPEAEAPKKGSATPGAEAIRPSETDETAEAAVGHPSADDWKDWSVKPSPVSDKMVEVYQKGLAQGNDPHAFSILGDCQSQPEVFMGVYDNDPEALKALPEDLQETVTYFSGNFDRYSPTVKDATTEGALLWIQWNDNKEKKCTPSETPVDCELRVHKPSIAFIHVGTHWEARNRQYLEKIIGILMDHGTVPVLVTKADNREKDERVNHNLASLAEEYGLPMWNFWASVQHLPDNGLKPDSDMYLNDEAMEIHRRGALEALDSVWRSLNQ
jgi:hypothetical protein